VFVTDSVGGPLEGAAVTIAELERIRFTSNDGNAVFLDVPRGQGRNVLARFSVQF
jgi:hypothetical protein